MRRTAARVVISGTLVLLVATPAGADRVAGRDTNDAAGPLDIARIVHEHRSGDPDVFVHKIVMFEPWKRSALNPSARENRGITVTFDVRPRAGSSCIGCITEREVLIFVENRRLTARLYNHLGDPPRKLADLPVWRPNRRSVVFAVRKAQLMRRDRDHYDWGVQSAYARRGSESCPPRNTCFDLAPRRNDLLRHRL